MMLQLRDAVVAGAFYPGDKISLENQINKFLEKVPINENNNDILGIISPHAGYVYSGQTAAFGFKTIENKDFDLAVIIAPSHRVGGFDYSIGNFQYYETPLGNITVSSHYVEQLLEQPGFDFILEAHTSEHSLEVQLPFLKMIKPDSQIVPIVLGNQNGENSLRLSNVLYEMFKDRIANTIFIISSDLSHYHNLDSAKEMDHNLAEYVRQNLPEKLEQNVRLRKIEACGFGGILVLMYLAELLNYRKIVNLKYSTSGEINNDYSQVVGYLSSIFMK